MAKPCHRRSETLCKECLCNPFYARRNVVIYLGRQWYVVSKESEENYSCKSSMRSLCQDSEGNSASDESAEGLVGGGGTSELGWFRGGGSRHRGSRCGLAGCRRGSGGRRSRGSRYAARSNRRGGRRVGRNNRGRWGRSGRTAGCNRRSWGRSRHAAGSSRRGGRRVGRNNRGRWGRSGRTTGCNRRSRGRSRHAAGSSRRGGRRVGRNNRGRRGRSGLGRRDDYSVGNCNRLRAVNRCSGNRRRRRSLRLGGARSCGVAVASSRLRRGDGDIVAALRRRQGNGDGRGGRARSRSWLGRRRGAGRVDGVAGRLWRRDGVVVRLARSRGVVIHR